MHDDAYRRVIIPFLLIDSSAIRFAFMTDKRTNGRTRLHTCIKPTHRQQAQASRQTGLGTSGDWRTCRQTETLAAWECGRWGGGGGQRTDRVAH